MRIYILPRREGWKVNHKRVYRLYCEEGLNLRTKRPKGRVSATHRVMREKAVEVNDSCSMDFVSDSLFNGRRFRALTIVDNFVGSVSISGWIRALKGMMSYPFLSGSNLNEACQKAYVSTMGRSLSPGLWISGLMTAVLYLIF